MAVASTVKVRVRADVAGATIARYDSSCADIRPFRIRLPPIGGGRVRRAPSQSPLCLTVCVVIPEVIKGVCESLLGKMFKKACRTLTRGVGAVQKWKCDEICKTDECPEALPRKCSTGECVGADGCCSTDCVVDQGCTPRTGPCCPGEKLCLNGTCVSESLCCPGNIWCNSVLRRPVDTCLPSNIYRECADSGVPFGDVECRPHKVCCNDEVPCVDRTGREVCVPKCLPIYDAPFTLDSTWGLNYGQTPQLAVSAWWDRYLEYWRVTPSKCWHTFSPNNGENTGYFGSVSIHGQCGGGGGVRGTCIYNC